VVQSRPITTLFPVPEAGDDENHVYLSVGHQQMMTDAMRPLGIALWQMTTPRPMNVTGGRLFVDVTQALASPAGRASLFDVAGRSDPLIRDALQTIVDRGDFLPPPPASSTPTEPGRGGAPAGAAPAPIPTDRAIVVELVTANRASVAALKRDIASRSGPALLDFILEDLKELRRLLFDPRSAQVFMGAMEAAWWLNDQMEAWLGVKNAADAIAQSVPDNVTSEMGLALLDVADVVRRHPAVVEALCTVGEDEGFLEALPAVEGGREARDAIEAYLDAYGMRCVGEIDLTRPRWSEQPTALVPMILANVRNFEPGAGARRFEQGRQNAAKAEGELLARLRALPDGEEKAAQAKQKIDRVRTFMGYREYPKYGMVSRYLVYKQALMVEAERLVRAGVLREKEDVFYLSFEELHDVVRTGRVDEALVRRRRDAFRSYEALTPPRVLTSDGEALSGSYRRSDLPPGALVGLPVSAGTVEGRARVVHDVEDAILEPGDILVTPYTDPSFSPLFVAIAGLVTEVGGRMTHGAVIAREYGLPAVVGVEKATRRIRDGQRIRVHGTEGYVELLPAVSP
ncbi:MAG TPA: phosphoenolpyruvate synthase, partial [Polyangiaceae bacterium]